MTAISYSQAEELKNLQAIDVSNEAEFYTTFYAGSERQFKLLYQRYAPALLGIIIRIVKSEVLAEDVLQKTFVKIWRSMAAFDSSRGRLFTWMAATARKTAIDQLRSSAQIKADNMEEFDFGGKRKHEVCVTHDTVGLSQMSFRLPSSEKQILDLIYYEGYTYSEAAEQLNIPLEKVKMKLRDAVLSLRQYI